MIATDRAVKALLAFFSIFNGRAVGAGDRDGIPPRQVCSPSTGNQTVYDFRFRNVYNNETFDLAQFRGKLTLYHGLNALQSQYGAEGFQIVGFPSNQFHHLEPAWNGEDLMSGIRHNHPGGGFVPGFPLTWKIDSLCPATTRKIVTPALYSPVLMTDIRWNYEKFLVGPDGRPLFRYSPDFETDDPQLNADIRQQLDAIKRNNGGHGGDIVGIFG
ncbi:GPX-like protein [Mya arenaria]|uniref:Glutathione peroxidase n=1 Tax=Mya arenaria TaxID=6604 RepID=A0ABY7EU08_MYAAR|nr:GPX-like protein [Mya arenaria]